MDEDDGFCIVENAADDLPLPEADESLLDLRYIHWGYLNCCHIISKGKKVKKAVWNTYWVDLCGATFRLYKDSSLPGNSAVYSPPVSQYGVLSENESKFAFFELYGAKITVLEDGLVYNTFGKKTRKKQNVYRRHLFQMNFPKLKSCYVFQASSHSSLLRWLSKIQESIDAAANNEISSLVEERLKFARFMMEKSHRDNLQNEADNAVNDDSCEVTSITSEVPRSSEKNPDLLRLKKKLHEKREFVWQIEKQIIDFLGNKGEFKRKEFTCATKQDYYLVPGRMETFIPAGTNVNLFGQLPNRRWRCLIEMDDLMNSMNKLIKELPHPNSMSSIPPQISLRSSSPSSSVASLDKAQFSVSASQDSVSDEYTSTLHIPRSSLPTYPMIGCLPESVLNFNFNTREDDEEDDEESCIIGSPMFSEEEIVVDGDDDEADELKEALPYSSHKRKSRSSTNIMPNIVIDSHQNTIDQPVNTDQSLAAVKSHSDSNTVDIAFSEDLCERNELDSNSSDSGNVEDVIDVVVKDEKLPLRSSNIGSFLLRNKLRQKGLSIMIGSSSSSEDEDDDDDMKVDGENGSCQAISNAVYSKAAQSTVADKNGNFEASNVGVDQSDSYIRTKKTHPDLKQSYSCDNINLTRKYTTEKELLEKFSQKSICLREEKDLAKELFRVFKDAKKAPDVKPPRNERRTLKLSKNDEEGFGFWLQTYGFGKQKDRRRTFVRYVEDEGPAYMAGLREGDVIVEVNGESVEELEHMKIVGHITEARKQLILVVKFMDAVRRVELAVRLKKKETQLKAKMDILQKLQENEEALLNGVLPANWSADINKNTENEADNISLNASMDSGLSSISSLSSDEVTVRTSKFEKQTPRVLDSIKELNCVEFKSSGNALLLDPLMTTGSDLLNVFSDQIENCRNVGKMKSGLKRAETMPVQKYRTLPRYKAVTDSGGNFVREYSIDDVPTEHVSFDACSVGSKDASSDDNDDVVESDVEIGSPNIGISRQNRQSYKLAMKVKLKNVDSENY